MLDFSKACREERKPLVELVDVYCPYMWASCMSSRGGDRWDVDV